MKISPETACPCGSGQSFKECCQKIHLDHRQAETAEALMRSRYSAFVAADLAYILKSWHKNSRPYKMGSELDGISWLKLVIHGCDKGTNDDNSGTVNFTAYYSEDDKLYALHEKSLFRRKKRLWYYLQGDAELKEIDQLP